VRYRRRERNIVVDEDIYQRINTLVDEEKVLREHESPEAVTRLAHIEETLDQCWDLLRRRRALREFGRDPNEAKVRDVDTVERYEQ
jgi:aminoglycoside N3'-acetyltransferase